ncbi:GL14441 [Drosophila persimilis]|uniref:GL14441 n=1 Tax=Drosophila persimilis TaxID=7234 RepID=B4GTX5_DROPE|nr:GL14441 [Drosophila persimilis]
MFNKTILVALILCACYLSAIQARPQLDVAQPVIAGVAQGATGGALTQPITGLTKIATGGAVLLPMAWCMPSQISRQEATTTTSARREIIKDFVARVQALIIELMEKLKALSALG